MGAVVSYFWWGGQYSDEEDPITGLSQRDIHNIRTTWAKIAADPIECGMHLLSIFIKKHPETQKLFKSFGDTPVEDLKKNRQFQAHSLNIITSLTSIINNLHQPDLVIVMSEKLGMSHNKNKITEKQFNDVKDVIIDILVNELRLDETMMKSWNKALTFIYKNIFTKIDK